MKRNREQIQSDTEEGSKVCGTCKTRKSFEEFGVNRERGDNLMSLCRACLKIVDKKKRAKFSKEELSVRDREGALRTKYGIGIEEYDAMLEEQGGKCAICGHVGNRGSKLKHLCVDHCHTTGKIRGLLCSDCNLAIGYIRDDISSLESAIVYLKKGA